MKLKSFLTAFLTVFLFTSCENEPPNLDSGETGSGNEIEGPEPEPEQRILSIENRTITMSPLEAVELIIKDTQEGGDTYTFTSTIDSVATVREMNGKQVIVPGCDGTATITVTTSDGKLSATATVTVTPFIVDPLYLPGSTWSQIRAYESSIGRSYVGSQNDGGGFRTEAYGGNSGFQVQYRLNLDETLWSVTVLLEMPIDQYETYFNAAKKFLDKRYRYNGKNFSGQSDLYYLYTNSEILLAFEYFCPVEYDPTKGQLQFIYDTIVDLGPR